MSDIKFEVRISGLVPEDALEDLGDVSVTTTTASTVITGELAEQAALIGLLDRRGQVPARTSGPRRMRRAGKREAHRDTCRHGLTAARHG